MKKYPHSFFLFLLLTVVTVFFIFISSAKLPSSVATHFGAGNAANAWMTNDGYKLYMVIFAVLLPSFIIYCVGVLPSKFPNWTNIPNKNFWLVGAQREESLQFLFSQACWLACMMQLMIGGIHFVILDAHRHQPPALNLVIFIPIVAGFLFALSVWIVILYRRFKSVK
jgi:hypothetical protein